MHIEETAIAGACLIKPTPFADERGLFTRTFDEAAFAAAKLPIHWPQMNTSWNRKRGTLRGMHFMAGEARESKLVRCTAGSVYDVILDLREDSSSYKRWLGIQLTAQSRLSLFIPPGVAHGFLTLEDGSEVFYQMGAVYSAQDARGVRWNDPAFAIAWPFQPVLLSDKDATYPDFRG